MHRVLAVVAMPMIVLSFAPPQQHSSALHLSTMLFSKKNAAHPSEDPSGEAFDHDTVHNRRMFFAQSLLAAGTALATVEAEASETTTTTTSTTTEFTSTPLDTSLPWQTNPVNKRSGVTVKDAEGLGYTLSFVTYLTRFLLNFDANCQRWWFAQRVDLNQSTGQIEEQRKKQFAALSASVEVGLRNYPNKQGAEHLLASLVDRYGVVAVTVTEDGDDSSKRQKREATEAKRQLILLFSMLEAKTQPTKEMTKLLAAVDNGSIDSVTMVPDKTYTGYAAPPDIKFPAPPAVGEEYQAAVGTPIMKETGKILRFNVLDGGLGYSSTPVATVSRPQSGKPAQVKLKRDRTGSIESATLLDGGSGYNTKLKRIYVLVSPPDTKGRAALLEAVPELELVGIKVTSGGSGYAQEKPLKILASTPRNGTSSSPELVQVGTASPRAERDSYTSFRKEEDNSKVLEYKKTFAKDEPNRVEGTGSNSGTSLPQRPFWGPGSSSSSLLLDLLPAGVGVEYDSSMKLYRLAVDTNFRDTYPNLLQPASNRPFNPDFGPRGRAPIERDMELGLSSYLKFSLSGAICASGVHLALTPLDVLKTKVQTNPIKYQTVASSFNTVRNEEGIQTFFTGWLPTLLSNLLGGACLYALTEFVRRSLSEAPGVDAVALEVPIILFAAGVASVVGSVLGCPFEAVRIRSVAQPDYAENAPGVVSRMVEEEGIGSLINAIPVFLVKNVPYAMTKFAVFDVTTERLYEAFPAAQEELKLSLLVTLVGGVLGGVAAAIVSNPADTVISELKKGKSDLSPGEAVEIILERGGPSGLFKGLPLRMVYYSLVASLQFLVYDAVRFSLGIGSDDLKLYLDVLGGALSEKGGPI